MARNNVRYSTHKQQPAFRKCKQMYGLNIAASYVQPAFLPPFAARCSCKRYDNNSRPNHGRAPNPHTTQTQTTGVRQLDHTVPGGGLS